MPPTTPKVGDIKSTSNGQTNYYTSRDLRNMGIFPSGGGGGSARGDDFAPGFSDSGMGRETVSTTPRSLNELRSATFGLAGGGGGGSANEMPARDVLSASMRALDSRTASGALSTDLLRAGGINTAQGQAPSSQGARSTRRVLSDKEVDDYARMGFREGDFIPNLGKLLPDGSIDASAFDQLSAIEKEAQAIQDRFKEMQAQEKANAMKGVSSDQPIVDQEAAAIKKLSEPGNVISGAMRLLEQQENILFQQLQAEIDAINKSSNMEAAALSEQQAREAGGLSAQLAGAGGYLGFSGSGTGVMLNLTKAHRSELNNLQLQRDRAIAEARAASANKQFNIVREKAALVERLENEAYERETAYHKEMKAVADKQKAESEKKLVEQSIFSLIQRGIKTPQDLFAALGGEVDIKTINSILTGFLPDALKDTGAGFKFTAANTASLLGTGLAQDDILALNEFVNENGYTEEVRKQLTPVQRAAADKIFRAATTAGGGTSSGSGKPMGVLELNRIADAYGVRFPFGVTEMQVTQFFNDNPGATPQELQAALDEQFGRGGAVAPVGEIEVTADMLQTYTTSQQKKLADIAGVSSMFKYKTFDIKNLYNSPEAMARISRLINTLRAEGFSTDEAIKELVNNASTYAS
jgi:hypothetical protein